MWYRCTRCKKNHKLTSQIGQSHFVHSDKRYVDPVKPQGYRKRRSRLKASRSPVYVPTATDSKREAAQWLTRTR